LLTLTFLGVGAAFAKRNFASNALVEAWSGDPERSSGPDDNLLVDFGATGPLALHQLIRCPEFSYLQRDGAIRYEAIRNLFITHLHNDHIGGLEELAICNAYACGVEKFGECFKPKILSTAEILRNLWDHSLRGGLGAVRGRQAELADYFTVTPVAGGVDGPPGMVLLDRYELRSFPTDHIQIHRKYDWPSRGLQFTDSQSGRSVVYTGDTRFDPVGLGRFFEKADLIFHEVQLEDHPDPVHTLLTELRALPVDMRKKMILYHYGDDWNKEVFGDVGKEFGGFARPGKRYELFA